MSGRRVVPILACLSMMVLATAWPAAAQEVGRLAGRVVEAESGRPLAGASVTVRGTSLATVTDARGQFIIPVVPAGVHTVVVAYLGRETREQEVTVTAGTVARLDVELASQALELAGIQVLGARALVQAEALTRQKNAPNIINVIASDLMGRFPDASAPEAVQRIPGVAVARDQGEGRYIQIRGGSPANTQVNVNGVNVPSPEDDVRQVALDAVPVDLLEAVEVSKAILPDMDADAIGGAVNLVTRRAPASRLLSVEAAGGFATIRDRFGGSGAFTFGDRFANGRLGLVLTASYNRREFGSDDLEPDYDLGDETPSDDALEELEVRHYTVMRARMGGTVQLDYDLSDNTALRLTALYTKLEDDEQRRAVIHAVEDDEMVWEHKNRYEFLETVGLTAGGDHLFASGAKLDFTLGVVRSREKQPYESTIAFIQEDVTYAPDLSNPNRIQANPVPGALGGVFEFDELEEETYDTRDRDYTGAFNLTLPYRLGAGATGNLKFGGKVRLKNKLKEIRTDVAELADGAAPILLGQHVGKAWGKAIAHPGLYRQTDFGTTPDEVRRFRSRFAASLDTEQDLEAESEDYTLDERVLAGYVMTELNLTPDLLLLPGVRYEHTKLDSKGNVFDADAETVTPQSASNSYGHFFPMVHLRYRLGEQTNLRAAFTTAIARPNFFDLVPFRIRDGEDIVQGNPDLEPTTSRNLDLLFEHYDRRIGVISAALFYKRLTNPIFLFTEDNELGGETEQPRNGESGEIKGVELAVQQQLSFLPGPLAGLGLYANYTYTTSEATLPGGRTAQLQGQSKGVYNLALSYERGPFSAQISANYHDSYADEYAGAAYEDVFVDDHFQLDFSASTRIGQRSTVFLELVNLTNEPYIAYQGTRSRPVQMEYYERWGRLGVRVAW